MIYHGPPWIRTCDPGGCPDQARPKQTGRWQDNNNNNKWSVYNYKQLQLLLRSSTIHLCSVLFVGWGWWVTFKVGRVGGGVIERTGVKRGVNFNDWCPKHLLDPMSCVLSYIDNTFWLCDEKVERVDHPSTEKPQSLQRWWSPSPRLADWLVVWGSGTHSGSLAQARAGHAHPSRPTTKKKKSSSGTQVKNVGAEGREVTGAHEKKRKTERRRGWRTSRQLFPDDLRYRTNIDWLIGSSGVRKNQSTTISADKTVWKEADVPAELTTRMDNGYLGFRPTEAVW